jgi:hypothetical protein
MIVQSTCHCPPEHGGDKVLVSDRIALAIQATLTLPQGTPPLRPDPKPLRGNIGVE